MCTETQEELREEARRTLDAARRTSEADPDGYGRAEQARVTSALERLEDGTWGWCRCCGRPIDEDRLRACPETNRCSGCDL